MQISSTIPNGTSSMKVLEFQTAVTRWIFAFFTAECIASILVFLMPAQQAILLLQ
jgi:hypothetical protein